MKKYDHKKIEKRWQTFWEKKGIYHAQNPKNKSKKKKYYTLIEFPYPSGDGLHVGHPRPYIGMDIISRKRRMEGYNVLYPIGWDAFGLPTENFAIKTGKDPRVVTKKNTDTFRQQIQSLGVSFDWSREINTTDPKYYKWTQWIFLQFLKKGLAYKAKMSINWCPKDKIGLANEEVINGACERCGTQVEKRDKEQWMLAITKYAERLHKDLDDVDYLPQIKLGQRNWIGKSEGAEIDFSIDDKKIKIFTTRPDTIFGATFIALAPSMANKLAGKDFGIKVDTDRENKEKIGIDTGLKAKNPANGEFIPVFAVNYVSAEYGTGAIMGVPAHDERDFEFAKKYNLHIKRVVEPKFVTKDGEAAFRENEKIVERDVICAVVRNPQNNKYLCVSWKEFKMHGLVTGGIEQGESYEESAKREVYEETGYKNLKLIKDPKFALHTFFYHRVKKINRHARFNYLFFDLINEEHDEINSEEAKLHDVLWLSKEEIKTFFTVAEGEFIVNFINNPEYIYTGDGILHDSGKFSGMDSKEAKKEIIKFVNGKEKTTFKLRDWVFSRQRYWGEPIPVIHCEDCGVVSVPEKDLPVELPKVKNYQPTDSGESPLANISKWVNVKCPKCKAPAKRETDTMPNWAGSSWYYLRYTDAKNKKVFADKKNLKYWLGNDPRHGGVNWYNGGNEHTTLHLLYSRFWHKFLYDLKLVPTTEPYMKRTSHGMILGEGGVKMSKSLGNVINPNDIVKTYGADTLRVYEMFMGPFDQAAAWSDEAIIGPRRFLEKVWDIGVRVLQEKNSTRSSLLGVPSGAHTGQNFSLEKLLNKTIKKVSEDMENMRFNTAISSLMILATEMQKAKFVPKKDFKVFLQILAPFAPHITEELWQMLGHKKTIHLEPWPIFDETKIQDDEVNIVVQVNGKVRGQFKASVNISEAEATNIAQNLPEVIKWTGGKHKKIIFIPRKIVNIVV